MINTFPKHTLVLFTVKQDASQLSQYICAGDPAVKLTLASLDLHLLFPVNMPFYT